MQPTTATTEASRDIVLGRFTIRSLLTWTLFVALPLACFRQYYALASNTADLRTTPLLQATPIALAFFAGGVVSILAIVSFLAIRRKFASAGALVIALTLCVSVGYPWVRSGILSPNNGAPQTAQLHNDAAAVSATALKFYYQRNGAWPKSWSELDKYLEEALLAQQARQARQARQAQPSNSVNSLPGISQALTIDRVRELVDIDFDVTPKALSKQAWFEFTGIRPHKPSYNLYRVEFQELIEALGN